MNAKEVFLSEEGDAYFKRNLHEERTCSKGTAYLSAFLQKNPVISSGGG